MRQYQNLDAAVDAGSHQGRVLFWRVSSDNEKYVINKVSFITLRENDDNWSWSLIVYVQYFYEGKITAKTQS